MNGRKRSGWLLIGDVVLLVMALGICAATVSRAQPPPASSPDQALTQLVGAIEAKDWHVALAAGLGLVAWAARRKLAGTSWVHTRGGALAMAAGLACIGAMVPLLSQEAAWRSCLLTGATAGLMALIGADNPSVRDQATRQIVAAANASKGMARIGLMLWLSLAFTAALLSERLAAPVLVVGALWAMRARPWRLRGVLGLVPLLALAGCGPVLTTALAKVKADEWNCAKDAAQPGIQEAMPLAFDAVTGAATDQEAVTTLDREAATVGVPYLVCALGHLIADTLAPALRGAAPAAASIGVHIAGPAPAVPEKPAATLRRRSWLWIQQQHPAAK